MTSFCPERTAFEVQRSSGNRGKILHWERCPREREAWFFNLPMKWGCSGFFSWMGRGRQRRMGQGISGKKDMITCLETVCMMEWCVGDDDR